MANKVSILFYFLPTYTCTRVCHYPRVLMKHHMPHIVTVLNCTASQFLGRSGAYPGVLDLQLWTCSFTWLSSVFITFGLTNKIVLKEEYAFQKVRGCFCFGQQHINPFYVRVNLMLSGSAHLQESLMERYGPFYACYVVKKTFCVH